MEIKKLSIIQEIKENKYLKIMKHFKFYLLKYELKQQFSKCFRVF